MDTLRGRLPFYSVSLMFQFYIKIISKVKNTNSELPFIVALDTWYAKPGLLRLDVVEAFLKVFTLHTQHKFSILKMRRDVYIIRDRIFQNIPYFQDAFAILPNPGSLVKRGLQLGSLLRDYDPKRSSVKVYLIKAERLGRSALQGVMRSDFIHY